MFLRAEELADTLGLELQCANQTGDSHANGPAPNMLTPTAKACDPARELLINATELRQSLRHGLRYEARRVAPARRWFPDGFPYGVDHSGTFEAVEPLPVTYHMGRRRYDVVGTSYASLEVYSPRAIECLSPFSGWRGYPIRVVDDCDPALNDYQLLAITGRCGQIQYDRSELRQERLVPEGPIGPVYYGLYFDEDSWDGNDLFMPEGTSYIIITEQVREALLDAKITNILFTRLTEFQRTWEP